MKNKEGFHNTILSDLKKGILRPLYYSDTLAILSVADSFYIASDYTVNQDGFVAFLVNSKMVRAMLVDDAFLEHLMLTTDQATLAQMMFRLTEKTFRTFRNDKKRGAGSELTHKLVDPELERWIAETYGAPPVYTAGEPERRTLMDSLRSLFTKDNRLAR